MRVYYDTEFWERGNHQPILPISYGFVREDGQELYLIDESTPLVQIANEHDWLRANVLPHLPVFMEQRPDGKWLVDWDEQHDDIDNVVSPGRLRHMVEAFLKVDDLELWGWYSAYDHVVLAQTFGTMAEMPKGIPYFTRDVRQEIPMTTRVPVQKAGTEHNALADAFWTRDVHAWWLGQLNAGGCPVCGKLHHPWCAPFGGQVVRDSAIGGSVVQLGNVDGDVSL